MNILERGIWPKPILTRKYRCGECRSLLEVADNDLRPSSDPREPNVLVGTCPVCQKTFYLLAGR